MRTKCQRLRGTPIRTPRRLGSSADKEAYEATSKHARKRWCPVSVPEISRAHKRVKFQELQTDMVPEPSAGDVLLKEFVVCIS